MVDRNFFHFELPYFSLKEKEYQPLKNAQQQC